MNDRRPVEERVIVRERALGLARPRKREQARRKKYHGPTLRGRAAALDQAYLRVSEERQAP